MTDDESDVDELTDGLVGEVAESFEAGSVERKNGRINRDCLQSEGQRQFFIIPGKFGDFLDQELMKWR